MIRIVDSVPDGFFVGGDLDLFSFMELTLEGKPYAYVAWRVVLPGDMVDVHSEFVSYGIREARELKRDYDEWIDRLRFRGIKRIITSCTEEGKPVKYIKGLGFKKYCTVYDRSI